jgi:hypothetical protein
VPEVDRENRRVYADLLFTKVSAALRAALKAKVTEMQSSPETELPDILQWFVDLGEARGEAKGAAKGEAKGEAKALLKILEVRGIGVQPDQRDRILECRDEVQLEGWIARAALARTADEVFA